MDLLPRKVLYFSGSSSLYKLDEQGNKNTLMRDPGFMEYGIFSKTSTRAKAGYKSGGKISSVLWRKFRRFSLLAGTALVGVGLAAPNAFSETFTIASGEVRTDPIDLTEDSTIQTVSGGSGGVATQTGDIDTEGPFVLTLNAVDANDRLAVGGNIIGDGSLVITGAGRVGISGTNSFSGGVSIDGTGFLVIDGDSALGTGTVTINNSSAELRLSDETEINNAIDLTVDGTLASIQGGEETVGFGGNIDTMGNVLTLKSINSSDRINVTGNILGAGGSISTNGTGEIALFGNSTFDGGVSLDSSATLIAGANNAFGTGTVTFNDAGARLATTTGIVVSNDIDFATDGTLGTIVDASAQTSRFSGAIDSMGNTVTLNANDAADNLVISGVISGAGPVVVNGNGTTTLEGANTFTGGTAVESGTLLVNGSTVGTTTVESGGTLGGTGTVAEIVVDGTVSPGTSIGTLNISGNATFNSGSIFAVELDVGGTSDLLDVGGTTTINGGVIEASLLGSGFTVGQTFTILQSTGAITGTFTSITSNLDFIDLSVTHNANDIVVEIVDIITLQTIIDEPTYASAVTAANNATGENAIDFGPAAVIGLTGDASVFDLGDGNSIFLLGNNATINGNGFIALQLASGTLNVADLTINGAVQLDGGNLLFVTDGTIGALSGAEESTLGLGSNTVTINQATDSEFSGTISGLSGALVKQGAGVLTLSGNNSFGGGISLEGDGGITALSSDALGSGTVTFDNANAAVTFTNGLDVFNNFDLLTDGTVATLAGDQEDPETGEMVGTSAELRGDFDTMGNTLTTNAVDANDDLELSGNISGAGGISNIGPGTTILSGNSSFSGGVSLDGPGVLQANGNNNALGTGVVTFNNADAALGLGNGRNFANDVDLATDGTLQTFEGGTQETELSGNVDTMGNALVLNSIDVEDTLTLSGIISGAGSLTSTGEGTTVLEGANTFTGGTTVESGALLVNGSIDGMTTVNLDGTLGGTGTLNGDLLVNGTLFPGSGIDTFTQTGNTTFGTDSTFAVEVEAGGGSSLFDVTGMVDINGGTLLVIPEADTTAIQDTFTVMTTTGGINGVLFDDIETNLSFLLPSFEVVGNNLEVTLDLQDATDFAITPNQQAIGGLVNEILAQGALTENEAFLMDQLFDDTALLPQNLDQLSGEGIATFSVSSLASVNLRTQYLARRVNDARLCYHAARDEELGIETDCDLSKVTRSRFPTLAAGLSLDEQQVEYGDGMFWMQGYGGKADLDNGIGNFHMVGFDVGYDRMIGQNLLIGVSTGYSRIQGNDFASVSRGETEYGHLGFHASANFLDKFYGNLILTAGIGDMETARTINFQNVDTIARGHPNAKTVSGYLEVGREMAVGGFHVQPFASAQYTYIKREAFTETNAATFNLRVGEQSFTSIIGSAGVRVTKVFKNVFWNLDIRPEVRARFFYEVGEAADLLPIGVSFPEAGTSTATITSASSFESGVSFGGGIVITRNGTFQLSFGYDAFLTGAYNFYAGMVRLTWIF